MKDIDNQHTFIKRRQDIEQEYFESLDSESVLKSISSVDITTIDLCNRSCVFCPRHDPRVYPNRNLRMTASGAEIIAKRLADIQYTGTIAISGFGENLLNPEIVDIVRVLRTHNGKAYIECNTNGDPLNTKLIQDLIEAGLDVLNINMYDGPDQIKYFDEILEGIPEEKYKYRVHWDPKDHGIIFNNRSGLIKWMDDTDTLDNVKNNVCYYPFYKLYIDWNGDVLFCANDWGRERVVGNLMQQPISEVWMSKEMQKVRIRLSKGNRNLSPCNKCNVIGTLVGKKSYDILMEHYNENRNHRKQ